jgi:hypothetical protein
MESTQLEVGSYEPFLFLDYKVAGDQLLKNLWMMEILEYASLCKGTIMMTESWLLRPQREHDATIVSIAADSEFTDKQKKQISACRIYLKSYRPQT